MHQYTFFCGPHTLQKRIWAPCHLFDSHHWAPAAEVHLVDTVFRAPCIVDQKYFINGVVTDIDESSGAVEIDLTVTNEAEETRVFGTAKVIIPTA